ncbi:CobQ/CobB/MinD/ParA nucleotide binding domain protein [Peptococcaceae bacterium CEB3]|nr:CobQ/CobB/MinD/ParA nucleotide binding domain protein [Peptococcaceae bacterium CEB3]
MKTVVICGPQTSSGVERVAELVRENGGNPIIVPMLSGFSAVPSAEVHIIFRKQALDLSGYTPGQAQVGIIYANNQVCDTLGASDLEKIAEANLLYLAPAENVSGWIRRTLDGDHADDEFAWNFVESEDSNVSLVPVVKPKTRLKIACYSPLGGIGKTTASVMIGKLAQESGHSVCIVESDNDNAGVLQALGAPPVTEGLGSILDEEWEQYDLFRERVQGYLQKVDDIAVLPIGADTLGMKCDEDNIANLYSWVNSQAYDTVIYDLPPQLSELSVYKTLQEVDTIILIGEPTIKAEEKLMRFITRTQNLQGLKDVAGKLKLIINKYVPTAGVKDVEIAETTGIPLIATVPADPEGYYRMINDRKLNIPAAWRDVWEILSPLDWGAKGSKAFNQAKRVKKNGFWKSLLGIK